jgi:hypothetical protein
MIPKSNAQTLQEFSKKISRDTGGAELMSQPKYRDPGSDELMMAGVAADWLGTRNPPHIPFSSRLMEMRDDLPPFRQILGRKRAQRNAAGPSRNTAGPSRDAVGQSRRQHDDGARVDHQPMAQPAVLPPGSYVVAANNSVNVRIQTGDYTYTLSFTNTTDRDMTITPDLMLTPMVSNTPAAAAPTGDNRMSKESPIDERRRLMSQLEDPETLLAIDPPPQVPDNSSEDTPLFAAARAFMARRPRGAPAILEKDRADEDDVMDTGEPEPESRKTNPTVAENPTSTVISNNERSTTPAAGFGRPPKPVLAGCGYYATDPSDSDDE